MSTGAHHPAAQALRSPTAQDLRPPAVPNLPAPFNQPAASFGAAPISSGAPASVGLRTPVTHANNEQTAITRALRDDSSPFNAFLASVQERWQDPATRNWIIGLVGVALGAFGLAIFLTRRPAHDLDFLAKAAAIQNATSASSSQSGKPDAAASEKNTQDILAKATQGDEEAMKQIQTRLVEGLSTDEVLALAAGNATLKRQRFERLKDRLKDDKNALTDILVMQQLLAFTEHTATVRDALTLITALPGEAAADTLFEVWKRPNTTTDTKELAESLLYSRSVQNSASPALKVTLALYQARSCEDFKAALPRAAQFADRRSLSIVKKLTLGFGCGPQRQDDCYKCLRDNRGIELTDALQKLRERPGPPISIMDSPK